MQNNSAFKRSELKLSGLASASTLSFEGAFDGRTEVAGESLGEKSTPPPSFNSTNSTTNEPLGVPAPSGVMEYPASQVRRILQHIFPTRQLVLSQFTFFNQTGVAKPTGELSLRGRRCYRLVDLLSVATVLALKEEGIPLKNIDTVPAMIQAQAERIFKVGEGCKLSGFGSSASLLFPGDSWDYSALETFLGSEDANLIFWSYDVGVLARQLEQAVRQLNSVSDGVAESSSLSESVAAQRIVPDLKISRAA